MEEFLQNNAGWECLLLVSLFLLLQALGFAIWRLVKRLDRRRRLRQQTATVTFSGQDEALGR